MLLCVKNDPAYQRLFTFVAPPLPSGTSNSKVHWSAAWYLHIFDPKCAIFRSKDYGKSFIISVPWLTLKKFLPP